MIDDNPSYVTFILPSALARCGVHTARVRFETLDELTDVLLAQTERTTFERTSLESKTVSRRRIKLANDIVGNDVIVNITPGGRSRRVFSLVDGIAYVIDCETYSIFWERTAAEFDLIIRSFTVGNRLPMRATCAKH